ncbi:hypothetical protein [Bradyrhizobium sp. WSM1253]|uniref:hypothetical protein n=1 Tax=Bradyrhizobium sp. WSM1253 TaxID=319003 RepID=UPI00025D2E37|nr:hypothetical protein [Bradyrhizobium sp. WSM1253]EIG62912.1 hypothetical protein Bra1253DRAFT_07856 [Bradyrhizobium sp. WSM1253]
MTPTHTVPERLAMLVCALLSLAVAAFVPARVYPVRHLLTKVEAQSAIGLLLSAALLMLGVALVVDWRRKRRDWQAFEREYDERIAEWCRLPALEIPKSIEEALATRWSPVEGTGLIVHEDGRTESRLPGRSDDEQVGECYSDSEISSLRLQLQASSEDALAAAKKHGVTLMPAIELQRHLTAALAVLLREPALTIDASTMRMLAKHKERRPVKRDEKGRWRRVQ